MGQKELTEKENKATHSITFKSLNLFSSSLLTATLQLFLSLSDASNRINVTAMEIHQYVPTSNSVRMLTVTLAH